MTELYGENFRAVATLNSKKPKEEKRFDFLTKSCVLVTSRLSFQAVNKIICHNKLYEYLELAFNVIIISPEFTNPS